MNKIERAMVQAIQSTLIKARETAEPIKANGQSRGFIKSALIQVQELLNATEERIGADNENTR